MTYQEGRSLNVCRSASLQSPSCFFQVLRNSGFATWQHPSLGKMSTEGGNDRKRRRKDAPSPEKNDLKPAKSGGAPLSKPVRPRALKDITDHPKVGGMCVGGRWSSVLVTLPHVCSTIPTPFKVPSTHSQMQQQSVHVLTGHPSSANSPLLDANNMTHACLSCLQPCASTAVCRSDGIQRVRPCSIGGCVSSIHRSVRGQELA
jgi:hypothetical protein